MTDEDLILDPDTLAHEGMRRDLAPRSHRRTLLDLNEGADPDVIADPAAVEIDERRMMDLHVAPECDVRCNRHA